MPDPERESLDARWQEYQELVRLTDHWYWRPGWRVGRSFYTWHLTFSGATALHGLVDTLQRQLTLPGLDAVPRDGLHLTTQGVGFTDEVSDQDVDGIVAAARDQLAATEPFELTLGPVDPDAEGIGLLVQPWAAVTGLRLALRRAIRTIWDEVPEPEDGFRPHVTIAYSAADLPAAEIRERLRGLRSIPPVVAKVDAVELIRLNRDNKVYEWTVHSQVKLGT